MKAAEHIRFVMIFSLAVLFIGCGGARKTITTETVQVIPRDSEQYQPAVTPGVIVQEVGEPEQLTNGYADNGIADFHPDGGKIVFQSNRDGKWQLYEISLPDGESTRILSTESNDENPVWSIDGDVLLFVSDKDGESEWDRDIYMYDPTEDIVVPVAANEGDDWYPVVTDKNAFYYLTETEAGNIASIYDRKNSLYRGRFEGSPAASIVGGTHDFSAPTMMDENRLVVLTKSNRLAVYDVNTQQMEFITPSNIKCGTSTYSRSRNLLAFSGEEDSRFNLYLLDLNKDILQQISHGNLEIRYPRFSPDASWLLYSVEIAGYYQIFRVNVEKTETAEQVSPVEIREPAATGGEEVPDVLPGDTEEPVIIEEDESASEEETVIEEEIIEEPVPETPAEPEQTEPLPEDE